MRRAVVADPHGPPTNLKAKQALEMVLAELALFYAPESPRRVGVIAIIVTLVGAVKYIGWYPSRNLGGGRGGSSSAEPDRRSAFESGEGR
jgi:hypothetical protein